MPKSVKSVGTNAFSKCKQLRKVELNEGLEKLGAKESVNGNDYEGYVFYGSTIESIKIPSTLKVIEIYTFAECENLKNVVFEEGLQEICRTAFFESGLEKVVFPVSLRKIAQASFARCKYLKNV